MTTHTITVDYQAADHAGDVAHAAFCEGCAWSGPWHHSDTQPGYDPDDVDTFDQAAQDALATAEADGEAHRADELDPPPSREAFAALRAPVTDRLGFAAPLTPPRAR